MVNSLYNSLVSSNDYTTLVTEHWSTTDASEKFIPAVKKKNKQTEVKLTRAVVTRDLVQTLTSAVQLFVEVSPQARATQADALR